MQENVLVYPIVIAQFLTKIEFLLQLNICSWTGSSSHPYIFIVGVCPMLHMTSSKMEQLPNGNPAILKMHDLKAGF